MAVPFAIVQLGRLQGRLETVFHVPIGSDAASFRQLFDYLPTNDALALAGVVVGPTLSFAALLALTVALTTLVLSEGDGRTIGGALRSVVNRAPAIVGPALVLAVGACILVGIEVLWVQALGDLSPPGTRELSRFGQIFGLILLADLGVLVGSVAGIYLAVRWAVAYPALVVEGMGLRAALRRSSELTRGRRLKVALTLLVVSILTSMVTVFAMYGAAGVTGSVLDISSAAGLVVSSVPVIAVSVLLAPFVPLTLVLLYRDLTGGPAPVG